MDKKSVMIFPFSGKKRIPSIAILALSHPAWVALTKYAKKQPYKEYHLHICSLFYNENFAYAGPVVGSPAAVMVMEQLIAMGAKMIIVLGCAGSLQPSLSIGDLLFVQGAFSEEGTSHHYIPEERYPVASPSGARWLRDLLPLMEWQEGTVWTTDAPYRELISKVRKYRNQGIHAVEMEISALFTVAKFRNISIGALVVISDELASLKWKPGFSSKKFKTALSSISEKLVTQLNLKKIAPCCWRQEKEGHL